MKNITEYTINEGASHSTVSYGTTDPKKIIDIEIESYNNDIETISKHIQNHKDIINSTKEDIKKYPDFEKYALNNILYEEVQIILLEEELKMCKNIINRLNKLK